MKMNLPKLFSNFSKRFLTNAGAHMKSSSNRGSNKNTPLGNEKLFSCVTYATADSYKLDNLKTQMLKNSFKFEVQPLPHDIKNAIHLTSDDKSNASNSDIPASILVFREGGISFWNVKSDVKENLLTVLKCHSVKQYGKTIIDMEKEEIDFNVNGKTVQLQNDIVYLSCSSDHSAINLQMYTVSNALVMSVKLAHWEHDLDALINSIKSIPSTLVSEKPYKVKSIQLTKKIGEIFQLRQKFNLQNNLLDVPDVYWKRPEMEDLYQSMISHLDIHIRVKQMNEKLSYCSEMVELLRNLHYERKSLRLELLIVFLILIEVIFEIVHIFFKI